VFSPEEARKQARQLLQAARTGGDSTTERKESRHGLIVADLAEQNLTAHSATKKKPSSAKSDASNMRFHVLPALGRRNWLRLPSQAIPTINFAMPVTRHQLPQILHQRTEFDR